MWTDVDRRGQGNLYWAGEQRGRFCGVLSFFCCNRRQRIVRRALLETRAASAVRQRRLLDRGGCARSCAIGGDMTQGRVVDWPSSGCDSPYKNKNKNKLHDCFCCLDACVG
jgi:hypothetical protein